MKNFRLNVQKRQPEYAVRDAICKWMSLQERKNIAHGTVVDVKGFFDAKIGKHRRPNHPWRKVGTPDWMGSWRGYHLIIEFKRPEVRDPETKTIVERKGSLSPEQREFIAAAAKTGAISIVAYGLDDVIRVLKQFDTARGLAWEHPFDPPVTPDSWPGAVRIKGQVIGHAQDLLTLKQVLEDAKDPRQTELEDFIEKDGG